MKTKVLDCTLRDGGYYTDWDFEKSAVTRYLQGISLLPIDYIEVGYRNISSTSYIGEFGFCPVYRLQDIRERTLKKVAIMLNEKDVRPSDLKVLTEPIKNLVDMVRIAVDPKNIERAILLAKVLKMQGFEVGFNVMYMSKWDEFNIFSTRLNEINDVATLFCMVDSFGSVTPEYVSQTIDRVRDHISIPIGFHAHNNLELSLANAIVAITKDIDFIDSTILGMGRGAGNLKTELLLTYINKYYNVNVDFNILGDIVSSFVPLLDKCKWGTNLPYMISGANSFPQKEVMSWVNNRTYSFNNIVRALDNKRDEKKLDIEYPLFNAPSFDNVLIVGGGENAVSHFEGIKEFVERTKNIAIIHATTRNAKLYQELDIPQFFCLVGDESQRMTTIFKDYQYIKGECILSPAPRIMGTDVPPFMDKKTFELKAVTFTDKYKDSCTAIAFQLAIEFKVKNAYIVGYDGYPNGLSQKEMDLSKENELLIQIYNNIHNAPLISITPTLYDGLMVSSLYQFLI